MRQRHPRLEAVTVSGEGHAPLLKDARSIRTIAAYQRVGWLAAKQAEPKPAALPRKSLERRLRKLEAEAAQLREQIDGLLPTEYPAAPSWPGMIQGFRPHTGSSCPWRASL